MKVSVIIAAYNIENYIERCINSIINQTYEDIEIIVVNDGSTDSTLDIVRGVSSIDKRIKIVNQNNIGLIEARKSGFNNSKGEFVLFIDGDDWLEINAIEELIITAEKDNSDVVIYNGFYSYDDRKIKNNTFNYNYIEEIKVNPLKHLFLDNMLPGIVYKFIKRDFIINKEICFPDKISYAEDLAMVSSIFIHNPKVSILDKYLYNYYQREGSVSRRTDKVLEINEAISFIENQLKKKGLYEKYKKEFEKLIYRHLLLSKILRIRENYPTRKDVYKQYKNRQISIKKNEYIQNDLKYGNINLRCRVRLYNLSYYLGSVYDFLRCKIIRV